MGRALYPLTSLAETDAETCNKVRPAIQPRVKCPGVGPEVVTLRREGHAEGVCPPQPPACCEAARRAEAAARKISDAIDAHPLLRLLQRAADPWWLAVLPPPPPPCHRPAGGAA